MAKVHVKVDKFMYWLAECSCFTFNTQYSSCDFRDYQWL